MHRVKVTVVEDALDANNTIAAANREDFDRHGVKVINFMSAPGAGKTTLLEQIAHGLDGVRVGVLEGDVQGSADADRIRVPLASRLADMPGPVLELRIELIELTEPAGRQLELLAAGAEDRSRLSEGLRQVRASTGSGSVCTVVEVAPWSRIPETRALFVPRDD